MNRRLSGLRVLTLALLLSELSVPVGAEIPDWVENPLGSDYPLWVSAEEAAPDGRMRWDLFHPHLRESLRSALPTDKQIEEAVKGATCIVWRQIPQPHHEARTPAEIYDQSSAVFAGHVVAAAQGFFNGNPGTLLEVAIDEVLKPPAEGQAWSLFYVFDPYARIRIEGRYLCGRGARQETAQVGTELIFALRSGKGVWPGTDIFWADDLELFFTRPDGTVSMPYDQREAPPETLDSLTQQLRTERTRRSQQ